jgi:translation elongation factor EF-1beta
MLWSYLFVFCVTLLQSGDNLDYYCIFNQLPPVKWMAEEEPKPKKEKPNQEPKKKEEKPAAAPAPAVAAAAPTPADDDDMFGDVDEDEDAAHELEMAQKAAAALKDKKKKEVIAKSNVMFDVKPFEAETDMAELEAAVRGITMDGLVWGGSKLAAVAYGVRKLVINTVIEDDKSTIYDIFLSQTVHTRILLLSVQSVLTLRTSSSFRSFGRRLAGRHGGAQGRRTRPVHGDCRI